jgi:uncharacterized protein YndB with AHSA1/START domain
MTEQQAKNSLRVSRLVKAPRDRVFAGWLDSASPAMQRFAPNQAPGRPMRLAHHIVEPRVGGRYRVSMIADGGPHAGTYTVAGTYLEIVRNERIVQTHTWEQEDGTPGPETRVTITFRDAAGGTQVTIRHEGLSGPEEVASHTGGWTEALENFAGAFS